MAEDDKMVLTEKSGPIWIVTINRPDRRNAVDGPTASALQKAFEDFERDNDLKVAVLTGSDGNFCAGADLKAVATAEKANHVEETGTGPGPMGPTRMLVSKPVIAAVEGYAVAGGLELALWCDLRVVGENGIFGVFCRRWGVPLIDGGTVRLPRIVGQGRALDMILTGRPVGAEEARAMGLANRVAPTGDALEAAIRLARDIAGFPELCMRTDRKSAYRQWDYDLPAALENEGREAFPVLFAEAQAGAGKFAAGAGRHGAFGDTEQ